MNPWRSRVGILLGATLVFGGINLAIWQKQQILANAHTILLPLAPVDPRSLMQGDYMILRYDLAEKLAQLTPELPAKGQLVIEQNSQQIVTHATLYHGQPLTTGQHLLNYRNRQGEIWLGAESFFFQEGQAEQYQQAKYAALKLDQNGQSVLIGLHDANALPIQAAPISPKR